jgi:hypothetical protein
MIELFIGIMVVILMFISLLVAVYCFKWFFEAEKEGKTGIAGSFVLLAMLYCSFFIFLVDYAIHHNQTNIQDYTLEETCIEYETIQHREFADELIKKCKYYDCVDYLSFENREQWLELLNINVPISIIECKSLCGDEKGFDEYMFCIKENIRNRLPQKAVFTWNETKCIKWEAKLIREANE